MEQRLLEKLKGSQPVTIFSAFYGTLRLITTSTRARQVFVFWSIYPVHIFTHFLKNNINVIIPSKLGVSKWSVYLRFPPQNLYTPFCTIRVTYLPPTFHSAWFKHLNNIRSAPQIS